MMNLFFFDSERVTYVSRESLEDPATVGHQDDLPILLEAWKRDCPQVIPNLPYGIDYRTWMPKASANGKFEAGGLWDEVNELDDIRHWVDELMAEMVTRIPTADRASIYMQGLKQLVDASSVRSLTDMETSELRVYAYLVLQFICQDHYWDNFDPDHSIDAEMRTKICEDKQYISTVQNDIPLKIISQKKYFASGPLTDNQGPNEIKECTWSLAKVKCVPPGVCARRYKLWDGTLSQSCRLL